MARWWSMLTVPTTDTAPGHRRRWRPLRSGAVAGWDDRIRVLGASGAPTRIGDQALARNYGSADEAR